MQQNLDPAISRRMGSMLNIIKFRRCVISVIFINKLAKFNPNREGGTSSTTQFLSIGLGNIKNEITRCISSENIDQVLNDERLYHGIIQIFNAKDFYNKSLFSLESWLDRAQQSESDLKRTLADQDAQLKRTQEEMAKLVRTLDNTNKKYTNKKEAFKALQTEL